MCVFDSVGFCRSSGPLACAAVRKKSAEIRTEREAESFFICTYQGEMSEERAKINSYSGGEQASLDERAERGDVVPFLRLMQARVMFVIELTYKAPLPEIDAQMKAHVAFLKKYYAAGHFLVSGRQIPRAGG